RLTSTTEPAGESLSLSAAGNSGSFIGSITTSTGSAQADGKLEIANNDTITVSYVDSSAGVTRTATARADLVAPVITSVTVTNGFGAATVLWNTDEPATAIVRYGTNTASGTFTLSMT